MELTSDALLTVANRHRSLRNSCSVKAMLILVLLQVRSLTGHAVIPLAPNISDDAYYSPGDVLIGGVYSVRVKSNDVNDPCGGAINTERWHQNIEAIAYAVNEANANDSILPGVKLGFYIVDDCRRSVTTLAKSVQFVNTLEVTCPPEVRPDQTQPNKVVGVVGPTASSRAVEASKLLSRYRIPVISPEATSDELTDNFDHSYFNRLVPPNKFQAVAIVGIIQHHNWTYISLLYSSGKFGSDLADTIIRETSLLAVCIAYSHQLPDLVLSQSYFDDIVKQLLSNIKARVVVLALTTDHLQMLMPALRRAGAVNTFIFIGPDSFDERAFLGYEDVAMGAIFLTVENEINRKFQIIYENLNPSRTSNPWFPTLWENIFGCRWNSTMMELEVSVEAACGESGVISAHPEYYFNPWTTRTIDSVNTLILALHAHVLSDCHHYIHNTTLLQCCIQGSAILAQLRQSQFIGGIGPIKFDDNGDLLGDFLIYQLVQKLGQPMPEKIGAWASETHSIIFERNFTWYLNSTEDGTVPVSKCSDPCGIGQITIQLESPCCWECLTCRENEITSENSSLCIVCPQFTWPDSPTLTSCLDLQPTYIRWSDLYGVIIALFPTLGCAVTFVICLIFAFYSDRKIIKASNRPLMVFVFLGVYMAFITALTFVVPPATAVCSYGHVGFHLSCSLIYGPLCVKTTRVYRIFLASKHFRQPQYLVNDRSQVLLAALLVTMQVVLMMATVVVGNLLPQGWSVVDSAGLAELLIASRVAVSQPVAIEPYVELYCERPPSSLLPPLIYNLGLLVWAAALAFLTRKLPDAFNESWYILLSVSATLVVWSAFIPTYFLMFYAYYRETLLSMALSINAICNLLLFFLPKVYAIFWVTDDQISTSFKFDSFKESRVHRASRSLSTLSDTSGKTTSTITLANTPTNNPTTNPPAKQQPQHTPIIESTTT